MTATSAPSEDLELTAEQFDHLVETLARTAEQIKEVVALLTEATGMLTAAERVR